MNKRVGFTVAELLIALAVLGVIATFTIPKVLQIQSDAKYKAIVKESAAMFAQGFYRYKADNGISAGTGVEHLTPYFNYIKYDTTSQMDKLYYDVGAQQCDNSTPCLKLANGAMILYAPGDTLGGTAATNAIRIMIDPDGKITQPGGPLYGEGKSTALFLYTNGRITSYAHCLPGTASLWNSDASLSCPEVSGDPPYIRNWD